MRYTEHRGYPWASWGIRVQSIPTGTWAGFLMESAMQWVGSTSLWCPLSGGCYSLRLTSRLRVVQLTSVFCMWNKEVGVFGRVLYSWGSLLPTHTLSPSFKGEIMGLESSSWHWSVPPWGRGDRDQVKLFYLASSVCPVLDFFPQWCAGISLLDYQTFIKAILSMGDCQKLVFFGRQMAQNSYFAILITSLNNYLWFFLW